MATSDEASACVPLPPVELSSGNTLKDSKTEDTASSNDISDGLVSTSCEVTTMGYELHADKLEAFRSESYVSDTDAEDIYLTETELESNSYAEQIEVTVNHAGPHAGIDVRGVSQWDQALTEHKDSSDNAVTKLTSAVATSSCSPTELDSSLSVSESTARTESTSTSPSAERGKRKIDIRVKSRSRSRTDSLGKGVTYIKNGLREEAGDRTCCSSAESKIGAQEAALN